MSGWLKPKLDEYRFHATAITHRAVIKFVRQVCDQMANHEMTQSALSEKTNINKATISRLLSGEHNITIRTIGRIAAALGCDIELNLKTFEQCCMEKPYFTFKTSAQIPRSRTPKPARIVEINNDSIAAPGPEPYIPDSMPA